MSLQKRVFDHINLPHPGMAHASTCTVHSNPAKQTFWCRTRLHGTRARPSAHWNALPPSNSIIDAARNDLSEFCQLLDDGQDACWNAYEYLSEQQAEAQHEVERGSSTARMERLQAFVRQLMSDGDVRDLLYALQPLSRLHSARTRCEEQGVQPAKQESDAPAVAFPGLDPTPSAQHIDSRQKLLELFATVDDDVNGRINASQFRAAMELLGDDLTGDDVATIFDSFDIDAYSQGVDFESFANIVEAEGVRSHGPYVEMLRRLRMRPGWWSTADE